MVEPLFEPPGQSPRMRHPLGGDVAFKVRGEQSGGALTAFETVVAPGQGPPLHTHAHEDETLYVLDGEVRFKIGDDLDAGGPGSFVFVPRGTPHTFQNIGEDHARILIHFTPSGMERFFERFAALEAPDPDAFTTIGAEVGMAVVGRPLAEADPPAGG
jgi:quercetin dioxygenase-like cupin family protein